MNRVIIATHQGLQSTTINTTKIIDYVTDLMENNTIFKDLCKTSKLRLFSEYYMNSNYYKEQDLALQVAEERGRSNNDTQSHTTSEAVKALRKMDDLLDVIDLTISKSSIVLSLVHKKYK